MLFLCTSLLGEVVIFGEESPMLSSFREELIDLSDSDFEELLRLAAVSSVSLYKKSTQSSAKLFP